MYANLKNLLLLKRLNGNLSKTRAELENIQRKKLISLIHHAYENTRYYRDLFDSTSLRPSDIRSVEDPVHAADDRQIETPVPRPGRYSYSRYFERPVFAALPPQWFARERSL